MVRNQNPEETRRKILELGSQIFWRYDLWKVVLFQAPEFHLKEGDHGKRFITLSLSIRFECRKMWLQVHGI